MNYGIKTIVLCMGISLVTFATYLGFDKTKKNRLNEVPVSTFKEARFQDFLRKIKKDSFVEIEENYNQKFNCKSPCSVDSNK